MARAFEPFERGRSSNVQSQPGIGLGLAITRVLVQVLGGEITASSTPGGGSRFRVKLMLSSVAPASQDAPGRGVEGYSGPRRTILIIEDDCAQRSALQSLLTSLDFVVHAASTGQEGIDLAAQCSPGMVLLDVEMPGISGWETARKLREIHGAKLKILLVTAMMTDPEAREPGAHAYDAMLAKPIAFDALFTTMQQLGVRWNQPAPEQKRAIAQGAAVISDEARPYLGQLHRTARIGHVLEFEKQLAELEHAVPAAASLAVMLRTHLDDFDFGAIIEKIENAGA
jgi:CheY-like chemotaxis protein